MVQWLELNAFTAESLDSVPGQGKDPTGHVAWAKKKKTTSLLKIDVGMCVYVLEGALS